MFVLLGQDILVLIIRYANVCLDSKVSACPDNVVCTFAVRSMRYIFVLLMGYENYPPQTDTKPNLRFLKRLHTLLAGHN